MDFENSDPNPAPQQYQKIQDNQQPQMSPPPNTLPQYFKYDMQNTGLQYLSSQPIQFYVPPQQNQTYQLPIPCYTPCQNQLFLNQGQNLSQFQQPMFQQSVFQNVPNQQPQFGQPLFQEHATAQLLLPPAQQDDEDDADFDPNQVNQSSSEDVDDEDVEDMQDEEEFDDPQFDLQEYLKVRDQL